MESNYHVNVTRKKIPKICHTSTDDLMMIKTMTSSCLICRMKSIDAKDDFYEFVYLCLEPTMSIFTIDHLNINQSEQ